jgi:uncharacterized protein (TIGR00369 family)
MNRSSRVDNTWIRSLVRTIPLYKLMGMRLTKLNPGRAEMRMRISKKLTQDTGIAHGGVIAALVDSVIGFALWSLVKQTDQIVTIELKVNYLAPARPGLIKATGKILRKGGHIAFGTSEVRNHRGLLVATGSATYMTFFEPR